MNGEISIFDNPVQTDTSDVQAAVINDPDAFGCCSRYRECSDAGKCVNPNEELSAHCVYRNHLNNGRVFYGKEANDFSASEYKKICQRVDALPQDARQALDNLLIDFFEFHRSASCVVIRNAYLDDLLSTGLFSIEHLGPGFFDNDEEKQLKWRLSKIKDLMESMMNLYPDQKAAFKKAQNEWVAPKEGQGAKSKHFMRVWLNNEGKTLRDTIANPYRFAFFSDKMQIYGEELWNDTVKRTYECHIYRLSPLLEDGFYTIGSWESEELRRIKLSRGYSKEEKASRIAKIERARAARTEKRAANADANQNTMLTPKIEGEAE